MTYRHPALHAAACAVTLALVTGCASDDDRATTRAPVAQAETDPGERTVMVEMVTGDAQDFFDTNDGEVVYQVASYVELKSEDGSRLLVVRPDADMERVATTGEVPGRTFRLTPPDQSPIPQTEVIGDAALQEAFYRRWDLPTDGMADAVVEAPDVGPEGFDRPADGMADEGMADEGMADEGMAGEGDGMAEDDPAGDAELGMGEDEDIDAGLERPELEPDAEDEDIDKGIERPELEDDEDNAAVIVDPEDDNE